MSDKTKNPCLQGNFAPVSTEADHENITSITGKIPEDLNGVLYRNGPNPHFPQEEAHWFQGDGMIHGIFIENGKVSYRNRWVRTEKFLAEEKAGMPLFAGWGSSQPDHPSTENISKNTANTNVIYHGNKLLALQETKPAIELDFHSLETQGDWKFDSSEYDMSAHPHFDYETGEMHTYNYNFQNPQVDYLAFDKAGNLLKRTSITAPFCSFMHDFMVTKDYVIFPVMPITIDIKRPQKGLPPIMWEPEKGAHIGIMPKNGTEKDLQWFGTDPFYAFHFMNAYQENDTIILDGMKSKTGHLFPDASGNVVTAKDAPPNLTRWAFSLSKGTHSELQLDDTNAEFPRFDERFTGIAYQHGFCGAQLDKKSLEEDQFDSLIHYNHAKKTQTVRSFGYGNMPSEPVFVPRHKDSNEGEGYLLSVVFNSKTNTSDLYILDAENIDKEALAIVHLPQRIPMGFHGNWVSR